MAVCPIVRQDLDQWMVLVCPTLTLSSMCLPSIADLEFWRSLVHVKWKVN